MTGLHIVKKPRAGLDRFYVYAWRGGPCIHRCEGARPVITPDIMAAALAARVGGKANGNSLDAVIAAYKASPEHTKLAYDTQRDYNLWLDRISGRFGSAPVGAFEDRRMRGVILEWRDQWAAMPRSADKAVVTMGKLLGWAMEHGRLSINVAAGIKLLHHVNKADQIWERHHMRAMTKAPAHLRDALKLAAFTGLRLGDLVRLSWDHVGDNAIVIETKKRKGRAVIPITPTLRRLLEDRSWRKGAILRNTRGQPWTASGLGTVFQKKSPDWFDRTIHDLRGTFVTWLAIKGLTDEQIARIVGWTAKRVGAVRARYVDEARVVVSLIERLSA